MKPAALFLASLILVQTSDALRAQQTHGSAQPAGPTGTIAGRVTNAVSGAAVPGLTVEILNEVGKEVSTPSTDGNGHYATQALPAGSYYVRTAMVNAAGLISQMYDKRPCWGGGCPPIQGTVVRVVANRETPGIDFALAPGGEIRGWIRHAETGQPVAKVGVSVIGTDGSSGAYSDDSGAFRVMGLPSGAYMLRVQPAVGSGLVVRWLTGAPCRSGDCTKDERTEIIVRAPVVAAPITIALQPGGSITGRITNRLTAEPLPGVEVTSCCGGGETATTDAYGAYTIRGLATGSFTVQTRSPTASGFIDEVYDGVSCWWSRCDPRSGTPVAVKAPATTAGINFALQPGARISGRVTNALTGAGIPGARVQFTPANGLDGSATTADADGKYISTGLVGGAYFVRTEGPDQVGMLDQLHDHRPCPRWACDVRSGTPVRATVGQLVSGIDFSLTPGGSISGTVVEAATGAPVRVVQVTVRPSAGGPGGGQAESDAQGRYVVMGLPSGSYRVAARPAWEGILGAGLTYALYLESLLPQVFGAKTPDTDDSAAGSDVKVSVPETTSNVNFSLLKGGTITGKISHARTGEPLPRIGVSVSGARHSTHTSTNDLGVYVASGLPTGNYILQTDTQPPSPMWGPARVLNQVYKGVPCAHYDCSTRGATPVPVTAPETRDHIDFALIEGGIISGVVRNGVTGAPAEGVRVEFLTATGEQVGYIDTDEQGRYASSGLASGRYFAMLTSGIRSPQDVRPRQVYKDRPCPAGPCDITAGTPIEVVAPAVTSGIDFTISPGGTLSGTVTDSTTGQPVAGARVKVYSDKEPASPAATVVADAAGKYSFAGLADGVYLIQAGPPTTPGGRGDPAPNNAGMVDQLYGGAACQTDTCRSFLATARPVEVRAAAVTANVDIALVYGGTISGRISDAATGQPIRDARVAIHAASGPVAAFGRADIDGNYTSPPLPPGTYYLRSMTPRESGFLDVLYPNVAFWTGNLSVKAGEPVTVAARAAIGGKDFALRQGGRIEGTVTTARDGKPVSFFEIKVYTNTGVLAWSGSQDSRTPGKYATSALPAGSYFIRTSVASYTGLIDEAYGGSPCPGAVCKPTTGTPVVVRTPSATTGIDFALKPGGRICGSFGPDRTMGIGQTRIAFLSADGTYIGSTDPSSGSYASPGMPAGSYFVRTFNTVGLVDQQYKGASCPAGVCPPASGQAVTVAGSTSVCGIDFQLAPGPRQRLVLVPNRGPASGGTIVEIATWGFDGGVSAISIGGKPVTSIDGTWSLLKVVIQPGPPGPADVAVTTVTGTVTLSGGFTYVADRIPPSAPHR